MSEQLDPVVATSGDAPGSRGPEVIAAAEEAGVDRALTHDVPMRQRILMHPQFLLVVTIVAFSAYVTWQNPAYLEFNNWTNIFRNAVFIFIVAAFSTYVLVSSGLDLSVGSVFLVGSIAVANFIVIGVPIWLSIILAVALGSLCGLVNGTLITYVKIPAFIATLGMLYVARGLATFVTGGRPIAPLPEAFTWIGQGDIFGVPLLIIYAVIIGIGAHIVLEYSPFGWGIRAIGGNTEAARAAGIDVRRIAVVVYVLSGTSAAFAGMLMAARLGSGQPSVGNGMELQVISAVIIGGTSLFGGIGTVFGTLLGALVLSMLSNGLILLHVDAILQNVMVGCIIVAAVALDQFRRGRMFRALRR
jgi:ribose/xylose/arabinose/galactoside ABC-type transport system permease subunit